MTTLKHSTTATASRHHTPAPGHRSLARTGALATLLATAAITAVTALSKTQGVDFAIGENGDVIPTAGVSIATAALCALGVVLAAALRRWSTQPSTTFVRATLTLTAVSLVPPLISGGDAATVSTLILLHLLAAAVVIPALARTLRS